MLENIILLNVVYSAVYYYVDKSKYS